MEIRSIKKLLGFLTYTPLHLQWLLSRTSRSSLHSIARILHGTILDIGCGHKAIKDCLDENTEYIGLDYYHTAVAWYGSRPDIYASAASLPLRDACMQNVLLLDVLEHVPDPLHCLQEIHRVLLPQGTLIIQVPFLYPVHDKPLDFHRWTTYGISGLLERAGFLVTSSEGTGSPFETAGLLFNLAMCKSMLNLFNRGNPLFILALFLPVIVPLVNLCSLIMSKIVPADDFMPFRYRVQAAKTG